MCLKLYPAVFLALFLRKGRLRYIPIALGLFLVVSAVSLSLFQHTVRQDLALWRGQLAKFRTLYIVGDNGMSGSASLWNAGKLAIYGAVFMQGKIAGPVAGAARGEARAIVERALPLYSGLMALLAVCLTLHVTIVEKDFWRRVALLLVFMIVSAPAGGEYKMVHLIVALAGILALDSRRRADLMIVVLLAGTLVPKKYWFWPHIVTDSGQMDCSLGVFLNPLLMVTAAGLLCRDGWSNSTVRGRALRWASLREALRLSNLRRR